MKQTIFNKFELFAKSDTVNFVGGLSGSIYVGGSAGDVAVVAEDGTVTVFPDVQPGTVLPIRAKRINSTSTGSGEFVVLYSV